MIMRHRDKSHMSDHLRLVRLFLRLTDPADRAELLALAERLAAKPTEQPPQTDQGS